MAAEEHGARRRPRASPGSSGTPCPGQRVRQGEDPVRRAARPQRGAGRDRESEHAVERVAFEVCHRINAATPITETALVALALLGARTRADAHRGVDDTRAAAHYVRPRAADDGRSSTERGRAAPGARRPGPPWHRPPVRRRDRAGLVDRRGAPPRGRVLPQLDRPLLVNRAIAELVLVHVDEQAGGTPSRGAGRRPCGSATCSSSSSSSPGGATSTVSCARSSRWLTPSGRARGGAGRGVGGSRRGRRASRPARARVVPRGIPRGRRAANVAQSPTAPIDESAVPRRVPRCRPPVPVAGQTRERTESISRELFATALKLAGNRGLVEPAPDGGQRAGPAGARRSATRSRCWVGRIARLRELELARLPR